MWWHVKKIFIHYVDPLHQPSPLVLATSSPSQITSLSNHGGRGGRTGTRLLSWVLGGAMTATRGGVARHSGSRAGLSWSWSWTLSVRFALRASRDGDGDDYCRWRIWYTRRAAVLSREGVWSTVTLTPLSYYSLTAGTWCGCKSIFNAIVYQTDQERGRRTGDGNHDAGRLKATPGDAWRWMRTCPCIPLHDASVPCPRRVLGLWYGCALDTFLVLESFARGPGTMRYGSMVKREV